MENNKSTHLEFVFRFKQKTNSLAHANAILDGRAPITLPDGFVVDDGNIVTLYHDDIERKQLRQHPGVRVNPKPVQQENPSQNSTLIFDQQKLSLSSLIEDVNAREYVLIHEQVTLREEYLGEIMNVYVQVKYLFIHVDHVADDELEDDDRLEDWLGNFALLVSAFTWKVQAYLNPSSDLADKLHLRCTTRSNYSEKQVSGHVRWPLDDDHGLQIVI